MIDKGTAAQGSPRALAGLLAHPRFEVIPVRGIESSLGGLPAGATVTVTASPKHGLERTFDAAVALDARGFTVVPHVAARMVAGRGQLERLLERLEGTDIREAFVVGGDADPPAGSYADAAGVLEALSGLPHPFARIGIGGYPEGHPSIPDDALLDALLRKQPYASHIVTQLCFDPDALVRWVETIRAAGVTLPVIAGIPGAVERRKLAEISLQTGVGASLRYLRKHGRQVAALARARRYDPTPLAAGLAARIDDGRLELGGAHLFTFNQVEPTLEWLARVG